MPPITAVVGRQPILKRDRELAGYELLFRPLPTSDRAKDPDALFDLDGDQMTNEVIFSALGIGIERLTGGKPVFCNADRGVLTGRVPVSLPPKQTIIEVLETVPIDDDVLAGCRALKRAGYRIAADDFVWFPGAEALLELTDIVKIDLRSTALDDIPALMELCRPYSVQLLAEKIETADEFTACREMGFDYYQGYYLERPKTITARTVGPSRMGVVKLASAVLDDDIDYRALERILRTEPELSYQLLQLAAIGRFGETRRNVSGLRQALVLIGLNRLRGWIPALLLRPVGKAIDTNLPTVLGRARLVESLASRWHPGSADLAFTAGLMSGMDLLLGIPQGRLADVLEIPKDIHDAAFDRENPIGRLVGAVIDYEQDRVISNNVPGFSSALLAQAAAAAFGWAMRSTKILDGLAA